MIEFIRKRDGRLVPFEEEKIAQAIIKAVQAVGGTDMRKATEITRQVGGILSVLYKDDRVPTVENVQDLVEKILIENGHAKTAKAYILYRRQHESLRQTKEFMKESIEAIDSYLVREDWRVNENANMGYSLRRVQKTKPVKKVPQADAIFANVRLQNSIADSCENDSVLRISLDAKARIPIGAFDRGGYSRVVLGALLGLVLNNFTDVSFVNDYLVFGLLHVIGAVFVASLKMMVVPLVFVSLVGGVTSLGNLAALGRMSAKALLLYLFTTAVAVSIAMSLASMVGPGEGFEAGNAAADFQGKEAPPLSQVFIDLVPSNPIDAMAEGNMLQIIVFALLFGIAITLSGERGKHVLNLFRDLDVVIMHMVEIVMRLAPYGVFALISKTFATQGLDLIAPLASYFLTLMAALALHAFITYPLLLSLLGGLNPITFLRKMRDPATFAFSTASSGASPR